ncbi:inositol monophosphatase [Cellulomonas sp. DKR-3]|uniref:Inositol-1-monophosphatase n=1 Tax=Cellulomonas fulva TaxID=2835530 RepID=A0ABS5U0L0_9CELL|nr:inositol monophosphatase family protein [Cellulomonas fulva]MBT0994895.1 inositol monophosphatase [Cellulomonas fulva]
MTNADPALVHELMTTAEAVAREAGALVHGGRPTRVTVHATKTSPVDVVTAMDLASETLVRERLAELRPDDGILGEEQGFVRGSSGITWVVDPIDGTVNYLYGLASWSVSVAAVVAGPDEHGAPDPRTWTVLAGAVHSPTDGRTYVAGAGQGATLDGAPLRVNDPQPLDRCLVGTGFGYLVERRRAQAVVVADLLPRVRDIRRLGSAALDLCAVAGGGLDLYYERGLAPWDMAAAGLVASEAGAVVTGLRGRPATDAMTVAGPPGGIDPLLSFLEDHGADATA